jgi:hypothetical protein
VITCSAEQNGANSLTETIRLRIPKVASYTEEAKMEGISSGCTTKKQHATLELLRKDEKLGFHRNRVAGFLRPTKRLAASAVKFAPANR